MKLRLRNKRYLPKYEIYVDENLSSTLRVLLWSVPASHDLYTSYQFSMKNITLSHLINNIKLYSICPGLNNQFACGCIQHSVPKLFSMESSSSSYPLHQSKWYRAPSCFMLIRNSFGKCSACIGVESKEMLTLKRKKDNITVPAKSKAPISLTSPELVKLTLQNYRLENKQLKEEVKNLQHEISSKSLEVDDNLAEDLVKIMSGANQKSIPPFMKLFWEEQHKYLSSSKTGVRYHPMIIRYCLGLAAKSPAMYDEIRFDGKTNSGFVILPSRRRLRDYKNYIRPQQGFNNAIIKELLDIVSKFQPIEKYGIILMDEMKIQGNLVWDKHTNDLIGFVDLGDTELNYATLKKSDELASHVLVFLVRSIDTSDGASTNRKMYRMHLHMTPVEHFNNDVDVVYRTLHTLTDENEDDRYIYFISDPHHLIKTARNCIQNSLAGRCTRSMWNCGSFLTWNHISKLFYDDLDCVLKLVPNITNEHINLTSYSVMNVRLAAQVLSESVYQALTSYGPPEASGTAKYCQMLDKFFDCLNVKNTVEASTKCKPFLKPYNSLNDERFAWLINNFLQYFEDLKQSIDERPGQFTPNAKANMFISRQTFEGMKLTVHSSIELIQYLLNEGLPYVLTEKFCQDPLENCFGRQRAMGHRKDNPSLRDFGYNDNTIRTTKLFKPIAGNCRNEDPTIASLNVETVPCRPRNKSATRKSPSQ